LQYTEKNYWHKYVHVQLTLSSAARMTNFDPSMNSDNTCIWQVLV